MFDVVKRDGEIAEFNLGKINDAIAKAFEATGKEYNDDIIGLLSLRVSADFQSKIKESKITVEDIQDSVENVLEQTGYTDVAKAYILYRKQREKMRNMKSTVLDYKNVVDSYVKVEDWRVKENSTVTYSVGGLILSNSGAITANYWLSEIYDEEIANAHRSADIHIHDLSMLTGYCAGWSLKQLIQEGLGGITGKITSAPAKHLSVLCNQMVNFLGIMQNEWAGAQAFSSFDTYRAPFIKTDNLSYEEVKKCLEAFIYGVNTPSRWGTQAPFSNITLDWTVPNDLAELPAIVGGKEMDFKYKDCKKEMDMVNKAFLEIMIEGDANGRGFQYPIPTYSITRDFDWSDTENNRLLFEMTAKYGTPYFSNYINSDMEPSDVRSMCCRLRLDLRELRKKSGGFFGSGESTGSVGVVTINMPRIAYQAKDEADFYARLDRLMDISARSLKIKRGVITKLLDEGLYPYTKRYLGT
ncbi:MAG: ribonucleoside triphosphate reductase, partial [Pseudobutyrivibrio sp.]|nr:ribonucleoside triphosphate reductase [Pseudobutyrivibrio sp.]